MTGDLALTGVLPLRLLGVGASSSASSDEMTSTSDFLVLDELAEALDEDVFELDVALGFAAALAFFLGGGETT